MKFIGHVNSSFAVPYPLYVTCRKGGVELVDMCQGRMRG